MTPRPRPDSRPTFLVGVDVASVGQLAALMTRQPGIAEEIFTERELAYAAKRVRRAEHLAARFAAKEAVFKALGRGVAWRDVEVVNGASGRPRLRLHGGARAAAVAHGVDGMEVSLSHSDDVAVAFVVLTTSTGIDLGAVEVAAAAALVEAR